MAANFKKLQSGLTFQAFASDPSPADEGDLYFNSTTNRMRLYAGGVWQDVGSGSGGLVKATFHDPVSTTLPVGASPTVDGVTILENETVLFSNLTVGANKIYKATNVAVSVVWTAQLSFSGSDTPTDGDTVIIAKGNGFADQIGKYTGTDWEFNFKTRYFNGADYYEQSSLNTTTLLDNTTGTVYSVSAAGSENHVVEYSLKRGTIKETGTIYMTYDGTTVSVATANVYTGSAGVTFTGDIDSGNIRLRYTTTSTGSDVDMKFLIRRWSDTSGGPGGVPSYSGGSSPVAAAGANGDIQFNASGTLGGNTNFKIDTTVPAIKYGSMEFLAMQNVTLLDNQTNVVGFMYSDTYKFAVIEYSLLRNAAYRTGRLLVVSDGINASIASDHIEEGGLADITFTADVSGGNIRILYTSTSTGFNADMKYIVRRW